MIYWILLWFLLLCAYCSPSITQPTFTTVNYEMVRKIKTFRFQANITNWPISPVRSLRLTTFGVFLLWVSFDGRRDSFKSYDARSLSVAGFSTADCFLSSAIPSARLMSINLSTKTTRQIYCCANFIMIPFSADVNKVNWKIYYYF